MYILVVSIGVGVVCGPTVAQRMGACLTTAIMLSSTNAKLCGSFSQRLNCSKGLRVYKNDDLIGVKLGGAVKNRST